MEGLLNKTEHDEAQHISEAVKDTKLKLDHAVSCCDEAQKRYVALVDNKKALAETEWISRVWELYSKISSEAQIFVSRHGNLTSASVPKSKVTTTLSGIKLEKIRLRQFSGDIRQYKKHVESLCDPQETALVLRSHLSDEVCFDVENLGDDIEKIWECLDRKYGDKGKLVDNMSDIKGMEECLDEDDTHTLQFIKIVEKANMDLRLLGKEDEMRNSAIVGFIEERLSKEMRKEWTQIVTGVRRIEIAENEFPHLLEFLLQYKERIEYNASQIRSRQPPEHKGNYIKTKERKSREMDQCWMTHRSDAYHPIWKCRLFQTKSPDEREELVRTNNACFVCLQVGHTNLDCWCALPHHQLLHDARPETMVFHS